MPLTLKRKPIFSGLGGPRSALVRPLFQVWMQGLFLTVFLRFSMIWGALEGPFGLPLALLFKRISDSFQDR